MIAASAKIVAFRAHARFAIERRKNADGMIWFAVRDADTVTDAEVKAGKRSRVVRTAGSLEEADDWIERNHKAALQFC